MQPDARRIGRRVIEIEASVARIRLPLFRLPDLSLAVVRYRDAFLNEGPESGFIRYLDKDKLLVHILLRVGERSLRCHIDIGEEVQSRSILNEPLAPAYTVEARVPGECNR
ncbi:MAG: hypothetical protein E6K56_03105 [Ignavibacteria bacterium]|nr:MAG: hypothetical protein E6K56_03105 [Ignavibacteria bacterium]